MATYSNIKVIYAGDSTMKGSGVTNNVYESTYVSMRGYVTVGLDAAGYTSVTVQGAATYGNPPRNRDPRENTAAQGGIVLGPDGSNVTIYSLADATLAQNGISNGGEDTIIIWVGGINNVFQGQSPTQIGNYTTGLINRLRSNWPLAWIVCCGIGPTANQASVDQLAASRNAILAFDTGAGSRTISCNITSGISGFNPTPGADLVPDGTHWSDSGAQKIAAFVLQTIATRVTPYLKNGGAPSPTQPSANGTSTTLVGTPIVDSTLATWTIRADRGLNRNGVPPTNPDYTSNTLTTVALILYYNNLFYHQNTSNEWWLWDTTKGTSLTDPDNFQKVLTGDPRNNPPVSPSNSTVSFGTPVAVRDQLTVPLTFTSSGTPTIVVKVTPITAGNGAEVSANATVSGSTANAVLQGITPGKYTLTAALTDTLGTINNTQSSTITFTAISGSVALPSVYTSTSIVSTPLNISGPILGTQDIVLTDNGGVILPNVPVTSSNPSFFTVTTPTDSLGKTRVTFTGAGTGKVNFSYTDPSNNAILTTSSNVTITSSSTTPQPYLNSVGGWKAVLNSAGDAANWGPVIPTITVGVPIVTSLNLPVITSGVAGSFQLTANGATPISWSITGLPSGMSATSGGLISWNTSVAAGIYLNSITATPSNGGGTGAPVTYSLIVLASNALTFFFFF